MKLSATWLLDLVAKDVQACCRSCNTAKPARSEHFHAKQLKAFVKSEEQALIVCLECASKLRAQENQHPVGIRLDWRTGVPLFSCGRMPAIDHVYSNDRLIFPYEGLQSAHDVGPAESPCEKEQYYPTAWVTNPEALEHMSGGFRYYPNFLTQEEEQRILDIVDGDAGSRWTKVFRRRQQFYGEVYYHTTQDVAAVQPALASEFSEARVVTERIVPLDMAPFQFLIDKFYHSFFDAAEGSHVFGPDRRDFPTQILVNEYLENFGISSHFEDEQAFGPVIATISLVSPIFMGLEQPKEHTNDCQDLHNETKLLLEPRSLFVMSDDCRYGWRHGISRHVNVFVPRPIREGSHDDARRAEINVVERGATYRRVSLTIRHLLQGRRQAGKIDIGTGEA